MNIDCTAEDPVLTQPVAKQTVQENSTQPVAKQTVQENSTQSVAKQTV